MPELPEVETTKRGIEQPIIGKKIEQVWCSGKKLRYPVSPNLLNLSGQVIKTVSRRAKYLIIGFDDGCFLIYHLGMSGMMRLCSSPYLTEKHDHVVLQLSSGIALVFNDPRRFGCVLWGDGDIKEHHLINKLGPEPLEADFSANHLKTLSINKKTAIKAFIMNNEVVVGVGNIYASEALYKAGIHPHRQAGRISLKNYEKLRLSIISVLSQAIKAGGTTLKDFRKSDGKPGYFQQKLMVYGRDGEKCSSCNTLIKKVTTGQRSSYYCPSCQK